MVNYSLALFGKEFVGISDLESEMMILIPPILLIYMCKYVLAIKRSAGVAPRVNLADLLHTDEESTLALKP